MDNQENKTPSTEPSETQKKSNKKKIIAAIAIIAVLAGWLLCITSSGTKSPCLSSS